MTDRINYLTVALDQDYRDDDIQPLVEAILQLRNVIGVTPHVSNTEQWIAEMRVKGEIISKIRDVLRP